jgi:hypothetical protein
MTIMSTGNAVVKGITNAEEASKLFKDIIDE